MILDREKLVLLLELTKEQGPLGRSKISSIINGSEQQARSYQVLIDNINILDGFELDKDIVESNVRLAKQKQRYQDTSRIERKSFREHARIENALIEYNKELINLLNNNNISKITTKHNNVSGNSIGILHLTDIHFNELIELSFNRYDFKVASKRLKKFITRSLNYFKANKVSKVLVACTGDFMNSDRRLDEMLNQASNRGNATLLGVYILEQILVEINKEYNIDICCVSGNESRANKEPGWSDIVATDNYDFTMFNMLKYLFRGSKGIHFISGDPVELVVDVNGANVLMFHGNCQKVKRHEDIQKIIGKYAARGIIINLVLYGHLHSAFISDLFARGGSPAGANDYSDKGLQLHSKASQNIHIVRGPLDIDSIKIDLQEYESVRGYNIKNELEAYNAKSASKVNNNRTIFKVVI